jgi:hypothetical protein
MVTFIVCGGGGLSSNPTYNQIYKEEKTYETG